MQRYTLEVRDRNLALVSDDTTLVRTATKSDELEVRFYDDEWTGYDLYIAFARGETIIESHVEELYLSYDPDEPVDEESDEERFAWCVIDVPDAILTTTGALGVTVHGFGSNDAHIITALSEPLEIMQEGNVL